MTVSPVKLCRYEQHDIGSLPDDFGCVYCDKAIRPGDNYYWMMAHGGNAFCSDTCKENWLHFLNYEWNVVQKQSNRKIETKPINLTRDEMNYLLKRLDNGLVFNPELTKTIERKLLNAGGGYESDE